MLPWRPSKPAEAEALSQNILDAQAAKLRAYNKEILELFPSDILSIQASAIGNMIFNILEVCARLDSESGAMILVIMGMTPAVFRASTLLQPSSKGTLIKTQ